MQSIKSYTDLEQSKKLAEILPLDSADMMYQQCETVIGDDYGYDYRIQPFFSSDIDGISCWSLAALLGVLPDKTCVYKKTYKDGRIKFQGISEGIKELILKDNPIDACVAMVERLHELNLL